MPGMPGLGSNPIPAAASFVTSVMNADWTGATPTPTTLSTQATRSTRFPGRPWSVSTFGSRPRRRSRGHRSLRTCRCDRARAFPETGMKLEFHKIWPACAVDEQSALAQKALVSARAAIDDARLGFDDAANDASFLSEAGVPTLVWGPGSARARTRGERARRRRPDHRRGEHVRALRRGDCRLQPGSPKKI